jgi:arylsulfatase A-like enzyme
MSDKQNRHDSTQAGYHIPRRDVLRAALGALAGAGAVSMWPGVSPAADAGSRPPNIIFILADDLGWDGLSCYGSDRYKTPALDALAADGLRFTNAYCTPLCGPTRCLLLTGRYGFRTGGLTNQSAGQPSPRDEISVAKVLKGAGYATAHAGKWRQVGASPDQWGFDQYITDPTAGGWYWTKTWTENGKAVQKDQEVYYHDEMFRFASDFMSANREKPFFLYFALHLVHAPIVRTPDSKPGGNHYEDNIKYMDKMVGQIVDQVEKLKLRDNTVILFSSDNGTPGRGATIGGKSIHGGKGGMLDGGSHVPLIASWKGKTPPGKQTADLVDFSDLLPTFAELGGAKPPQDRAIDGRSFAAQIQGQAGKPREWIFVQLGANWFVRDARWKLNNAGALFDMTNAPFEEKPVAADSSDVQAVAARQRLTAVLAQLKPTGGGSTTRPGGRAGRRRAATRPGGARRGQGKRAGAAG